MWRYLVSLGTAVAARRFLMRAFVYEQVKTLSTVVLPSGWPGCRHMCVSERYIAARHNATGSTAGSRTMPEMGATSCSPVSPVRLNVGGRIDDHLIY